MYKFAFKDKNTNHLDYPNGDLMTKQSCALITYKINEDHHDVVINVEHMHFRKEDLDELITFLTALNNKLKGL